MSYTFLCFFNSCNILIVVIVEFELLNQCAWPHARLKVHAVPMDHDSSKVFVLGVGVSTFMMR